MKNSLRFHIVALILLTFSFSGLVNAQDSAKVKNYTHRLLPGAAYTPRSGFIILLNLKSVRNTAKFQDSSGMERITTIDQLINGSTTGQLVYRLKFNYYSRSGWHFTTRTKLQHAPSKFFGIGNDTREEDEERFDLDAVFSYGTLDKFISSKHIVGVNYEIRYDKPGNFESDGLFETLAIPGEKGGFEYGAGPSFTYDGRDNNIYTTNGIYTGLRETSFIKGLGGQYGYVEVEADFRAFKKIKSIKNVIGLQVRGVSQFGAPPFYEMPALGGKDQLRGINDFRYIDKHLLYSQLEYRRKIYKRFGAVAFIGTGDVSRTFLNLTAEDLKFVYGGGLRYELVKGSGINLRVDYGLSSTNDQGFYFSLSEAF